jgi:hypothetical protein
MAGPSFSSWNPPKREILMAVLPSLRASPASGLGLSVPLSRSDLLSP